MKQLCVLFLILIFPITTNRLVAAPSCRIIKSDLLHFWEAYDSLSKNKDTLAVLNKIVFNQSSEAYRVFCKKWHITAEDLKNQLTRYPNFYASIRARSIELANNDDSIHCLVKRFNQLYKNFKGADICLAFGNFKTGGTIEITPNGNLVYIGMEFHTGGDRADYTEFHPSLYHYLVNGSFYHTLVHELVHVQQYTHGSRIKKCLQHPSLAAHAIKEGVPDFIAAVVCGHPLPNVRYVYGNKNADRLLLEFYKQRHLVSHDKWFGHPESGIPPDMGYFIGYCIALSYSKHHARALNDVTPFIEIKNVKKFIRKSRALQMVQWPSDKEH